MTRFSTSLLDRPHPNQVVLVAVVLTSLVFGGYAYLTRYLLGFDLPLGLVAGCERPWIVASILLTVGATFSFHHSRRRISLALAACAIAGPFAAAYDFFSSLSFG
jgi:hypothetical protein